MRAGLLFVLVSLAIGTAVRGARRAHEARFQELVERLEEGEMARLERLAAVAVAPDSAAGRGADGTGAPRVGRAVRKAAGPAPRPPALRPASIDVDRADEAMLLRLPGIGPALAARIVADRAARGPFGSPDGLLRVPGIGPKTLFRIRGYLAPPPQALADTASSPAPGRP